MEIDNKPTQMETPTPPPSPILLSSPSKRKIPDVPQTQAKRRKTTRRGRQEKVGVVEFALDSKSVVPLEKQEDILSRHVFCIETTDPNRMGMIEVLENMPAVSPEPIPFPSSILVKNNKSHMEKANRIRTLIQWGFKASAFKIRRLLTPDAASEIVLAFGRQEIVQKAFDEHQLKLQDFVNMVNTIPMEVAETNLEKLGMLDNWRNFMEQGKRQLLREFLGIALMGANVNK